MTQTIDSPETTSAPPGTSLVASRFENLERSCNELWTIEPAASPNERARLLRQLDDLECRITTHVLQLLVDPDVESELGESLDRCERRLASLQVAWGLGA